jgi:gentisate 1,2-dioxygenase
MGLTMDLADISDIPSLNQWLVDHGYSAYWIRSGGPRAEFKPFLWRWQALEEALTRLGQVTLPLGEGQEPGRRRLRLSNPHLGGAGMRTLEVALQTLLPGEEDPLRRHGDAAVRFVIKGSPNAATVVDGEAMPLETGDVITIPSGSWHASANDSDVPVIWLEALDGPLARLGDIFPEPSSLAPSPANPVEHAAIPLRHLKPVGFQAGRPTPPVRYGWAATLATLMAVGQNERQGDVCDGVLLYYSNPVSGGPALPTLAAAIQLLRPSLTTKAHRHNCTTFYYAVQGQGATVIGDERFEWQRGDCFVVPPWYPHEHENRSQGEAVLFSVSDQAAMTALQLYREEIYTDT